MTNRINRSPQTSGGFLAAFNNLPLSVKLIFAFVVVLLVAEIGLIYFSTTIASPDPDCQCRRQFAAARSSPSEYDY